MLLGVSDGERSVEIDDDSVLPSHDCLQFLTDMEIKFPNHIKVSFSFNYDVTMIMRDFSDEQQIAVYKGETVLFNGFRVRLLRNKWFEVFKGKIAIKIYDVFSFFGCSFMDACKEYIGTDPLYLELEALVGDGKEKRKSFRMDEMETIIRPYMRKELRLLVRLMNKMRDYLADIDLHLGSWHGPGAVASMLLKKHRIHKHRPEQDHPYVEAASQYAYMGGRFESFKLGILHGDVYGYDIRSAYPYALSQMPALDTDFFTSTDVTDIPDFSMCRVSYHNASISRTGINPVPLRSSRGAIYYPHAVATWLWGIEYKIAKKWFPDAIECTEVIRFNDNGVRPFSFISELYEQRREFKRVGNPVQLVCKLGMNSIYGKLAQRVGKDTDQHAPHHHQLRWAGFSTAVCRAMVMDAMMQAPEAMIAVETDGIYSEKPLTLDIGHGLGQWEESRYNGMLFIQSGVYFTLNEDGWSAGKTRGFTPNKTNFQVAMNTVQSLSKIEMTHRQFHGLPGAIGRDSVRSWTEDKRTIEWGGGGKRSHMPDHCPGCATGDTWHHTAWTPSANPLSHKHDLPWRPQQ